MVKNAGSVVGLDSVDIIMDKQMITKLKTVRCLTDHPLHSVFNEPRSSFSGQTVMPQCSTERLLFLLQCTFTMSILNEYGVNYCCIYDHLKLCCCTLVCILFLMCVYCMSIATQFPLWALNLTYI